MTTTRYLDLAARVGALLLALSVLTCAAEVNSPTAPPPLSSDAIVQRLMAANAQRAEALRGYRGKRVYRLNYHGLFGTHDAELQVEATYTAPDKKSFQVLSESGSSLLVNRVLLKLLSSEQEAQEQQNRKELEITPENYNFALAEVQHTPDGDFYVLNVTPKGRSRYLYRGKIWVDARDFAVARMEGEPQKNPSIWVSHTEIAYRWEKIDGFWLPARNQSVTQVRMGGRAVLTIDYSNYQITGVNRAAAPGSHGDQSLPAPSSVTADPH
jgi:outer membrane lipoprotein-sorting protein